MKQLNKEQTLAVHHVDGPMLVLAGPGSGKTRVLTERIRFLIEQQNISPGNILVLTFSKKAALEMQQRFFKLIGNNSYSVHFGTFHAVFFRILRQYSNSQMESKKTYEWKNKDRGISEQPDFDAMITDCRKLLLENHEQRRKWQNRYHYILVDEFQDSNEMQYDVLKILAGSRGNLFCVGDEDQSIYGFRGAVPKIMQKFKEDFPLCKQIELTVNYRCSDEIIQTAASLIQNNTDRIKACRQRTAVKYERTDAVTARSFMTKAEEANFVTEELIRLKNTYEGRNDQIKIAVLYRVQNAVSLLEEKLLLNGIPYERSEEQKGFYEEEWVLDVFAYLKLAIGSREKTCIFRILNKPPRELSRECVTGENVDFEQMLLYYKNTPEQAVKLKDLLSDINMISKMPPFAAVTYIRKGIGYGGYLKQKMMKQGYDKEDIENLFDELLERSRKFRTIEEWLCYLEELCLTEIKKKTEENKRKSKKDGQLSVILQTIHASKGLEYDIVFVIGLTEGILPHKKADTLEKIEEERRLLYVAMTRARTKLYLCAVQKNKASGISRFTKEMCCQFY